jgi:hypothetical protein
MKQFVRTANFEYINLDFVKSIVYQKIKDKELFEIVLECVDGEVSLGYVFDEDSVLDIINAIIEDREIPCDYMTYHEAIEWDTRRKKDD